MSKKRRKVGEKTRRKTDRSPQKAAFRPGNNLSKPSASQIKLLAGLVIIVCAAVLITHWPALSARALFFDDDLYLTDNFLVQNPGWNSAWRFLSEVLEPSTVHGYYQPLTMISLMLDHALGGRTDNLMPFHRTSLILHMANTSLVIVLLYLLFGQALIAAAVGLLFGLHPMTVETIPWVGERKTLLSAFFALWSLILYVRYTSGNNRKFYIGSLITYLLAVMSKPISLPLPVLMLLMDFWPLNRLKRRAVMEKLTFFVTAGIFAVITVISQGRTAAVTMPDKYAPGRIPLTLCHNIIFYPYKMLCPVNLSSFYAFPEPLGLSNPIVLAGLIGTCILIPLLLISLRWTRAALTSWLFFFIAIFPTMGVIGFTIVIAADKFAYLPSVGLLMLLTSFLCWFCSRPRPSARRAAIIILVLTLAPLEVTATRRLLRPWRDTPGLYQHMLTLTPDVVPMLFNLANALRSQDRTEEAISRYRRILQLEPGYFKAHLNLGAALKSQGRTNEAINHYRRALEFKPDFAEAHYNLGTELQQQGKLDLSITHYRKALQFKPDYPDVHFNLANAFKAQGRFDQAISHCQKAVSLYSQAIRFKTSQPKTLTNLTEVHNNLANLLSVQGKPDEAIRHFHQALQLRPDYAGAHSNLAWELKMAGQLDAAIEHFREALRVKPDLLPSLVGMAQILATHPDPNLHDMAQAVALAEHAAELTKYQDVPVLETLAGLYTAAGQSDQAQMTRLAIFKLTSAAQNGELSKPGSKQ